MISGDIIMGDIHLSFTQDPDVDHSIIYTVTDMFNRTVETFTVPQDKFFKALAIAVHNDGMPDAEKDYPDAESIQGKIRWIP